MENKAIKKATFAVFRAGESFADKVRELKAIVEGEDFHTVLHTLIVACDEFYYGGAGTLYVTRTRGADKKGVVCCLRRETPIVVSRHS